MASNSLARPFPSPPSCQHLLKSERLFIDSLLAQIHIIIVMIGWTGLAPSDFGEQLLGETLPVPPLLPAPPNVNLWHESQPLQVTVPLKVNLPPKVKPSPTCSHDSWRIQGMPTQWFHKRPYVGVSQARSWSPWLVLGAILWALIAKN